jgi:carbonic anhydrase
MKKAALSLGVLFACANTWAVTPVTDWAYTGEAGPQNWARLTPEFHTCSGQNQSPVNLDGFIEAELAPLKVDYAAGASEVVNNGHTVQVAYQPGSTLSLDGERFQLIQFHFHMPSENQIKGQSYPLEGHLVHADENGKLAVVAVMFKEGKQNTVLASLWDAPPAEGTKQLVSQQVNIRDMLPTDLDYYRFNGSLTTPPCSEGVRWLVLKQPIVASHEQIEALTEAVGHANNRPLQPVNARTILQ